MFGILNLNKQVGLTSRDCVNKLQKLLKPTKVGHAGTLDPIASGVLLVLIGQAVRLTDAIHTLPKTYIGTFQLGVTSESADTESPLVPLDSAPSIDRPMLESVLPRFTGKIWQTPPKYSAIWIDGKRAYELARSGAEFDIPSREVMIESLEVVSFEYPFFQLKLTCSTGTYVRSIGRDIALALGSDAAMTQLVRTSIGPFTLENSVSLDSIQSATEVENALIHPRTGVSHWPHAFPNDNTIRDLEQGKQIAEHDLELENPSCDFAAVLDSERRLRGLIKRLDSHWWRADKFFLLSEY